MTATTNEGSGGMPPVVPIIDRQRRYDRGIRVWGTHGQAVMEKARICLLNAGPTGSEALKNLVLGGIQSFTIVDGQKVQPVDLGNNYLVTASGLVTPRAQCVTECLKELNETVTGSYVEEDPASLISNNPDFFSSFDLVIGTQLPYSVAIDLDSLCRQRDIPLIFARSYGLVGYLRNCVKEHCVIESKPDSEVHDLRLGDPWPELAAAAAAISFDELDETEHSHIPYAFILVKAASTWKLTHDNYLPKTAAERAAFKDLIRSWQRSIDGCPVPEENFVEAIANAHKVWAPPVLSSEVKSILEDDAAVNLTSDAPSFWVLAAALRRFIASEGNGHPPLEGSLPDMHATTKRYLELQSIFREKADADAAAVGAHLTAVAKSIGRDPASIDVSEIKRFCRHARQLRLIRTVPLSPKTASSTITTAATATADTLRAALLGEDRQEAANASLLVILRAVDKYLEQYQRYPGMYDGELEEDVALLKGAVGGVLAEAGIANATTSVSDDLVVEMVRCGGGELQVVGAMMGAMASQEAIKLLTRQFVPLPGVLVFNGMHCTTSVFQKM